MGGNHNYKPAAMRPFTRANSQAAIEFNVREAVMEVVPLHLPVFIHLCICLPHFVFGSHQASSLELGSGHCCIHREFARPHDAQGPWKAASRPSLVLKRLQKLE